MSQQKNLSIYYALANAGAFDLLRQQQQILIKPNLVNVSPPPMTFPVEIADALIDAIRQKTDTDLIRMANGILGDAAAGQTTTTGIM